LAAAKKSKTSNLEPPVEPDDESFIGRIKCVLSAFFFHTQQNWWTNLFPKVVMFAFHFTWYHRWWPCLLQCRQNCRNPCLCVQG
jgi:hypothetical protein